MCLHSTPVPQPRPLPSTPTSPAKGLSAQQRQRLAVHALAGTTALSRLAQEHDVSRKFVYHQADKAQQALNDAFGPDVPEERVLFTLPVTKAFLRQTVLGLVLICHSSFRGAAEFLRDLWDYPLSLGSVANIVHQAVAPARAHNDRHDLSALRVGAHDEIFQAGQPVLVGVCAESGYCYLLSQEEHRDADTWGVRLLELSERGFRPEATIADAAAGLRAGQQAALPAVPCRGDVFHALREMQQVVGLLEERAYQAMAGRTRLEQRQARPGKRRDRDKLSLAQQLRYARPAEAQAVTLAQDVALLARWLREDILSVSGPEYAHRLVLFDFVTEELKRREAQGGERLRALRQYLENQREPLLAFVAALDADVTKVATAYAVPEAVVREVLRVQGLPEERTQHWRAEAALRQRLRGRYHAVSKAVSEAVGRVVRASSMAENLNSRLRGYFFLRRELGAGYLSLLQFFLNHRRCQRSHQAGREGKNPAELLSGQAHPHWLELLGYQRFERN